MQEGKIFIQIAAYRDPELIPTLKDCISQADHPENLRFCIAWQHSTEEILVKELIGDLRGSEVCIIDIPYQESKGACWARNRIQQEYNEEEYTLQLDSHHRFIKSWDSELINMYKGLQADGYKKPLITAYIPSYDPQNDPNARVNVPWKMNFDRFIPEGAVFFIPAAIDEYKTLTSPVKARFYSAHFAFTTGKFCEEVQHDPHYYFHGEEISIAARAYTHGYDLFHPHKIIAWHEYTRKGRTKHWDDHTTSIKNLVADGKDWGQRNTECHNRNRVLFSMDGSNYSSIDWGKYGFGTTRSLRDYEIYSGLCFSKRGVQQYTLDKKYPPNPTYQSTSEFEDACLPLFKHCIDLGVHQFPLDDYDFWCVAFEKSDGTVIFRKDVDTSESTRLLQEAKNPSGDKYIKLWREFPSLGKPHHWVVWPHSKSKGWCERLTGNL